MPAMAPRSASRSPWRLRSRSSSKVFMRRPGPFRSASILHLLRLLGLGTRDHCLDTPPQGASRLESAFRMNGDSAPETPALYARLCRSVPPVAAPPTWLSFNAR